jgi:hypothetical protein
LAKLERSVNASDKGGWIEMTEEPERVIEEYLALVNEHLPESISEDVITELRTYMFETALDLGNGELTAQSAKKVVAQFGAPSEVAEEYKYSMLPETLPPLEKETSHERLTEKQMMEPELDIYCGFLVITYWSCIYISRTYLVVPKNSDCSLMPNSPCCD